MFVLQATELPTCTRCASRVERGLACRGPALFSVFVGSPAAAGDLPPYLTAAAAKRIARVSGVHVRRCRRRRIGRRVSRSRTTATPMPTGRVEPFEYADEALQRVTEQLAFTFADFVLVRSSLRRAFRRRAARALERARCCLPPSGCGCPSGPRADRIPYLWAVDADDRLHRVIVDARLMQATRRCLLLWHRLQEHGGIHDSHAEQPARDAKRPRGKRSTTAGGERQAARRQGDGMAAPRGCAGTSCRSRTGELPSRRLRDDAWIETARCPSCNECQNDQRPDVHLQRATSRPISRTSRPAPIASWSRPPKLPGRDHPSGQAAQSERARASTSC